MPRPTSTLRAVLYPGSLLALASLAWAQGSPAQLREFSRTFSVGEHLSGHNAPSVQGLGMGGALVALDSTDPINPAQNAESEDWWAQVRLDNYLAAGAGDIESVMVKLAGPIGSSRQPQGLAFHYQSLEADPAPRLVPLGPPAPTSSRQPVLLAPAGLVLSETDWGVSYGRGLGRGLAVGLTIAGDIGVDWDLAIRPGVLGPGPVPVLGLRSGPQSGIAGARLGALYQASEDLRLGLLFSVAGADVTVRSPMTPPPNTFTFGYDMWDLRLGAACRVAPRTTVALELQNGHLSGAGVSEDALMWFGGVEQRLGSALALRLGQSDGSLTAGLGLSHGRWGLDYAYVNDPYRNSLQRLYGDTSGHFLAAHVGF